VNFPGVFENEVPVHTVTVSSFRMDAHEVTVGRFAAFIAAHLEWGVGRVAAALQNGKYLSNWSAAQATPQRPVVFVTWHAAQAYCRWAGGRLPTEAEWEYAARVGDGREFPWGNQLPTPTRANYSATALNQPSDVGRFPPNPWGLYDLAGNVWEWTLDEWQMKYPSTAATDPIAGGPVADATITSIRGRRTIRGGSYGGAIVNLRTRWRDSHEPTNAIDFVGFRCAYPAGG
jgi:formylglycine-generating enzyme required for sulfatase activity